MSTTSKLTTEQKEKDALVTNPLLFAYSSQRIYQLEVYSNDTNRIVGKVVFEYLNKRFEGNLILEKHAARLELTAPMILTPDGNYHTEIIDTENVLFNDWGLITTKGDETIGWLVIEIINHYNYIRLKPKYPHRVRVELN
jgi:hypothetical protein